ncbi:unnamed protein product [Orchesella dallaii]|uniref:Uncharacterized protein n=1 Tax=Orchesella dallaii TaxID=48710 RepID=A0ABP1Q714_9HEXA
MTPWGCVLVLMIGVVINLHAAPAIQNSNSANALGNSETKDLSPAEDISIEEDEVSSPVEEIKREAIKSIADETGNGAVKAAENISKNIKEAGKVADNLALETVQGLNKTLTGLITTSPKRAIDKEEVETIAIAATPAIESSEPVNQVLKPEASTSKDDEGNDAMNSGKKEKVTEVVIVETSEMVIAAHVVIEPVKKLEDKLNAIISDTQTQDASLTEGATAAIDAPAIQSSESVNNVSKPEALTSTATATKKARNDVQKSKSLTEPGIAAASNAKETVEELEDKLTERRSASDKHGAVAVTKQAEAVVAPAIDSKDWKDEIHKSITEKIEDDAEEDTKRIKKAGEVAEQENLLELAKELRQDLRTLFKISAVDAASDKVPVIQNKGLIYLLALQGMTQSIQTKVGNNTVTGEDIDNFFKEAAKKYLETDTNANATREEIDDKVDKMFAMPAKRDTTAMEAEAAFASPTEEEEALAKVANATAEIMNRVNEVVTHLSTPVILTDE